jgi:hypothetical protein
VLHELKQARHLLFSHLISLCEFVSSGVLSFYEAEAQILKLTLREILTRQRYREFIW